MTKRAIQVTFNEFLPDGADPSVDLIVALTRIGQGLWIPNTESQGWDASHPEMHTELLTADPAELRRTRARIIRLAKGWNSQYGSPGLCSFNIEALALTCITDEHGVPDGLAELFRFAASDLKRHLTADPAGVSKPIKLLEERSVVVGRFERAAGHMFDALANDDDLASVEDAMSKLYWRYVEPPAGSASKEAFASVLRGGGPQIGISAGSLVLGGQNTVSPKRTRSYGHAHE